MALDDMIILESTRSSYMLNMRVVAIMACILKISHHKSMEALC